MELDDEGYPDADDGGGQRVSPGGLKKKDSVGLGRGGVGWLG
jgi:hypothetical protein